MSDATTNERPGSRSRGNVLRNLAGRIPPRLKTVTPPKMRGEVLDLLPALRSSTIHTTRTRDL